MLHKSALWTLVGLFAALLPTVSAQQADPVEQYLAKLGLMDLQILHLEKNVRRQRLPAAEKVKQVKKLADLYAGRMMSLADQPERSQDLQARIKRLTQQYPQANTPSLQVMLLQADYNRAEALTGRWIADASQTQARNQALQILQQITPRLTAHEKTLNQEVDKLLERLDNVPEGQQQEVLEKELNRAQAVAGRAAYFAGWSSYYLGLTQANPSPQLFESAGRLFRGLLGIEKDQEEFDPEWLSLEVSWRSRAMIGLGLAEAAAGDLAASRRCFEALEHASVPPQVQDQAAYWRLQGLLNAGRLPEAAAYARGKIDGYANNATVGKVSLCVGLVRAGYSGGSEEPQRRKLGELGVEGLAKMRQHQTINRLLEQHEVDLEQSQGFLLQWIRGRKLLADADQKGAPSEAYQAAAAALENALKQSDAQRRVSSAAQCRYELAWCRYRLKEYDQAGSHYLTSVTGLKASDPERAAEAVWRAFVCYQAAAKTNPRYTTLAADALKTLKRDFPSNPNARKVDYYLQKLQRNSGSPQEAIAQLKKVPPDAPTYLAALRDICLSQHQVWSQASAAKKAREAENLRREVEKYLQAAASSTDKASLLKCCLLAVETALQKGAADLSQAQAYLDRAAVWAESLPASDSLKAKYYYHRLQWARRKMDAAGTRQYAQWLTQNASGTAYELTALVIAANDADRALQAASASQRPALLAAAYNAYQRLSGRLGASPQTLAAQANARAACSRLAQYSMESQRFAESARLWESLLAIAPKDKKYLRNAAVCHTQNGGFAQALPHWRTLLAGVGKASEEWFEAKYYQMVCLRQTDQEAAKKVEKQYRLLYYGQEPGVWKAKFQALLGG